MKCQSCGTENDSRARYCASCGATIAVPGYQDNAGKGHTKACPSCGQMMTANAMICANCGHSMEVGERYQTPYYAPAAAAVVTPGRKLIAYGLIATGLYFLWWGAYSVYYLMQWDWGYLGIAETMDTAFSFLVGMIVLIAGVLSMTKR